MSIAAMRQRASNNPSARIILRFDVADTAEQQLECVEDGIDWAIGILVEFRQLKGGYSEDQLTAEIVGIMRSLTFPVTHDEQIGGHVDIAVRMSELLWIAEAKIWDGCAWAFAGMKQLLTRYSPGLPGRDQAGLILYFRHRDAADRMASWRSRISREKLTKGVDDVGPLTFRTQHRHEGSGVGVAIRHFSVPLYWKPEA